MSDESSVDLYWIPLGAGGHFVRFNGRVYEALVARLAHRAPLDLYHSALVVRHAGETYAIEMTPVPRRGAHGAVAYGSVGARGAGRLRIFRYEIRRWRGGEIPDIAEAAGEPVRLTTDPATTAALLDLVAQVPAFTWGRDELGTGDMWNSNSVVSWLIVMSGMDVDAVALPSDGRAPGWEAGIAAARRRAHPRPPAPARRSARAG